MGVGVDRHHGLALAAGVRTNALFRQKAKMDVVVVRAVGERAMMLISQPICIHFSAAG
jgi:hypothetical protein